MSITPEHLVSGWEELRTVAEWAELANQNERRLCDYLNAGIPLEAAVQIPRNARVDLDAPPGGPLSWTWYALPPDLDPWFHDFRKNHPGGATLEEVGYVMGVTRERLRQLEEMALRRLRDSELARL